MHFNMALIMTKLASQNKNLNKNLNAILHVRMKTCKFRNGNVNMGFLEIGEQNSIFNVCTQPK
jgi:hypothetical protein